MNRSSFMNYISENRGVLRGGGGSLLVLLLLLLSWGVIVPVQADVIASYPCEIDTNDPVGGHNGIPYGIDFVSESSLNREVCEFNTKPDDKGHYIQVPHSDDFNLNRGPFTLRACIYQTARNGSYTGAIFANKGTANGWIFGISGEDDGDGTNKGKLKFRVNDDYETNVIRSPEKISKNEWHAVALVYDGTTARMYIDGVLVKQKSLLSPNARNFNAPLFIGKNSETDDGKDVNGHPFWWFGKMFNLGIEDEALSREEITEFDATCRPPVDLTVEKTGNGTVTGQDISCGNDCTESYPLDTKVTLTATPDPGYVFDYWSDDSANRNATGDTYVVRMNQDKTVTAIFTPLYNLNVNVTTPGTGTVISNLPDINCSDDNDACTGSYRANTKVTLTATANPGYVFDRWEGPCTVVGEACIVEMSQAQTVTAIFSPLFELTVKVSTNELPDGTAIFTGTVSSAPAGIDCGNGCTKDTENYAAGTPVTLRAVAQNTPDDGDPNNDYIFGGWFDDNDACDDMIPTCDVIMDSDKSITAKFVPFVIEENGCICFKGTGQEESFLWELTNGNGNTFTGTSMISGGDPATFMPTTLKADIANQTNPRIRLNSCTDSYGNDRNNCFDPEDQTTGTRYTLHVGPSGNANCPVTPANTVGCKVNPTIKFVPKSQLRTSIVGFIWNDLSGNGKQSSNEPYLSGWTVTLKKPNGGKASTVSDADGYYEFTGLAVGNYTVEIETRTGATYTTPNTTPTPQPVERTVNNVNFPKLVNFGIGEVGVPPAEPPVTPTPPGTDPVPPDDCSDKEAVAYPLYGVQDQDLNDSIFFTVNPADQQVTQLGETCTGCDIEALDIQPVTNVPYLASGNNARQHPNGHLYKLNPQTGELMSVGNTGFKDISSLAFDKQGTLWAWAKGAGLVQLDTQTGRGTLIIPSSSAFADLTWNTEGTTLYGAIGTELWSYVPATQIVTKLCDNLPEKTEAIRTLPTSVLPIGYLLLGAHQDGSLKLHAFHIGTCQSDMESDLVIPYDDVEGLAMPTATCQ